MMRILFLLMTFCTGAIFSMGGEKVSDFSHLETLDGTVYKDVQVKSVGVDSLRIAHDGGISVVRAEQLPLQWQKKYELTKLDIDQRIQEIRYQSDLKKREDRQRQQATALALKESGKSPRFLSKDDIQDLLQEVIGDISDVEAEGMSILWNKAEAYRFALDDVEKSYQAQWNRVYARLSRVVEKRQKMKETWEQEKKQLLQEQLDLKSKLALYEKNSDLWKEKYATVARRNSTLQDELSEARESSRSSSMTIVQPPVVFYPRPLPPPVLVRPCPKPSKPSCPNIQIRKGKLKLNAAGSIESKNVASEKQNISSSPVKSMTTYPSSNQVLSIKSQPPLKP